MQHNMKSCRDDRWHGSCSYWSCVDTFAVIMWMHTVQGERLKVHQVIEGQPPRLRCSVRVWLSGSLAAFSTCIAARDG
eukprot:scaffold136978_cov36-Prasinocladus_malaysianus.AAC.1